MGAIPNILAFTLSAIMRSEGNPKLSAIIMAVSFGLNIILDAIFIFWFGLGISGAAAATVISQITSAVCAMSYFLKRKANLTFSKDNLKLSKSVVIPILAIGMAPFAMQLATSGVQVISNNALRSYGGDNAIGAMATINSIVIMIAMPALGVNQGAQPIIGFNYGAKKYSRAKEVLKLVLMAVTMFFIVSFLVVQTIPEVLVRPFSGNNPELVELTANGLKKVSLAFPMLGITLFGPAYIQAIGKAKKSMFLSLLRQVILLTPCMLILPNILGLDGVWYAQPIADTIACIITIYVVAKEIKSQPADVVKEHPAELAIA